MQTLAVQGPKVLVLPETPTDKGSLLERFLAHLLHQHFGYEHPHTDSLNVNSEGVEIDVTAKHKLTGQLAMAECKAYERNVKAAELTNFYGKLAAERLDHPDTFGIVLAIPGLTSDGVEKAKSLERKDTHFKYINAKNITDLLLTEGTIQQRPGATATASDFAIVLTDDGICSAEIELDPVERTPIRVACWKKGGVVSRRVMDLLASSSYATGLPVFDLGGNPSSFPGSGHHEPPVILSSVVGSKEDFQYQLPASPKFFVGRKDTLEKLDPILNSPEGQVFVLNAQSGWGKSSLALKAQELARKANGVGFVFDTRTADHPRYVIEALRQAASTAQEAGVLTLGSSASWATLSSSLATLTGASWNGRPLLVFFDQFENVFKSPELTRTFRDLALGVRDVSGPLILGFAWKTDLVGWTEGHPFQLRDDIRDAGTVILVRTFGAVEVDAILRRLDRAAGVQILPDLRARLRAYSQGFPWLIKKLSDHVLKELAKGASQEQLLAESLNISGLFEADLAELEPRQREAIAYIARFAPVGHAEVTEKYGPELVQSLVNRRLIVQVGDKLDTYWDIFRDYITTGSVPVLDSYVLRQTPLSVARIMPAIMEAGGNASTKEIAERLDTSQTVVMNLSRELRLLGVAAHEPNRVRLNDEVLESADPEDYMRRKVAQSLRKHRAFASMKGLAERGGGRFTLEQLAAEFPNAFPAVDVAKSSWLAYSRAFLFWTQYANLVSEHEGGYRIAEEASTTSSIYLLEQRSAMRRTPGVPQMAPRRPLAFLAKFATAQAVALPTGQKDREAVGALLNLGLVSVSPAGQVRLTDPTGVLSDGTPRPDWVLSHLQSVPGGREGLDRLRENPSVGPSELGKLIGEAAGRRWTDSNAHSIGGKMRSWAKICGLRVDSTRRAGSSADESLFG